MKFQFDRDAMIKEVAIAQEIIANKSPISVLSNVLLISENNTLTINSSSSAGFISQATGKKNNKYMYFNGSTSAIAFTEDATLAAQAINDANIIMSGDYGFYHSGTNGYFMYVTPAKGFNLRFFKLSE